MHTRSLLNALLSVALGAAVGACVGVYQVERSVERMLERHGWVCGTGLYIPVYLWSFVFTCLSLSLYFAVRDRGFSRRVP